MTHTRGNHSDDFQDREPSKVESVEEILKEFEGKHKQYFAILSLDCKKCSHNKDAHYWNGGENQANSGYDSCRTCGCVDYEMDDFEEKIIGYEGKYNDIKSFLTTAYTAGRSTMRAEILEKVDEIQIELHNGKMETAYKLTNKLLANIKGIE